MYEEYFGFTGKPFQLSPDARFFYPSKEHKRALSFLQYGLGQADGFIVITGDVGTGKTTLVQTLLNDLDPNSVMCANIVTTQLEENDLLTLVCINLGIPVDSSKSKALLLHDLERFFIHRASEGRRVLLIVDEAQNLPPRSVEELRMLSNFTHDAKPLVQVFLLGQEEFRGTLLSEGFEQLRQRVIATYHLNPLTDSETRTYIEHRLGTVGWSGNPHFTDDAFSEVFRFSEGVPRRINNLCDRLLLFSFLEERASVDVNVVKAVAEEIGSEFWGRSPTPKTSQAESGSPNEVFNSPTQAQPLESMANLMFDKANFQQRLAAMESSIDRLTETTREELAQIRSILLRLVKTQARMVPPSIRTEEDIDNLGVNVPEAGGAEEQSAPDEKAEPLDGPIRATSTRPAPLIRRGDSPVSLTTRRRKD